MDNNLAVILPVYINDELRHFKPALESLIEQTYSKFDIVIVKDGPIKEEINNYLKRDHNKNIISIFLEKNQGLASALNKGIKYCLDNNYEFIARMDADDICVNNRFSKQLEFMKNNPEYLITGTNAKLINSNDEVIGCKVVKPLVGFKDMIKKCDVIHPSVMFRTYFFEKYGLYDEKLNKSQDYSLWLDFTKKGKYIPNIQESLIFFRYENNIIERRKSEQLINIKLKKRYSKFGWIWYSIPNLVLLLMPIFFIKLALKIKIALK
jgi:hypothetical protein